jgi:type I restriction-modification system DNA methylase subunit
MTIDYDLKREDIQGLANRDALVAFFAALQYNTETRIAQSAANLGIGTESVVREIKHIEQIASQDGLLHIYLFELTSVTVAITNALVRSFRNKQGEYLLVLTNDYERIDFILVERSIPLSAAGTSIGERHVLVKPRVLTIERRNPDRRQLRVLRRFTYTESDPFYQFDKLKSAYSIYDWSEEHFNNRILFADYFLQERLRDQLEWKEDVKPLYLKVREVMADASHLWNGKRESELRDGLFEKLFVALGFTFKKEKGSEDDSPKPDFLLYGKSSDTPLVICLCYPWGRSLDGKDDQRDQDTPEENPSAAVVSALKDGKTPWAIVTNGKLWRLFNAKTSSIAASYYEIDLEEILAAPSQLASPSTFDLSESFKYFSLFFRSDAFESRKEIVAGEERSTTFLDLILKGSEEYAKRLGERLKDRVFEEVFIHFAEGFVEYIKKRDGKDVDLSQDKLDDVFQGTLTLLYRFLFLLYAESRDLFPVKEVRGFYEKSLTRLKHEIAKAGGEIEAEIGNNLKEQYSVSSTVLYDRLLELFNIVDQGASSINVPMYNGGLFLSKPSPEDQSEDAELARFLLNAKVPDRYLAPGLDLLARDEDDKTFKLVPIDYKSLGVRQLGSIYEGLLEFKLHIAKVKMAIVKGKKTEEVVPYDQAVKDKLKILTNRNNGTKSERIIAKGKLYLENDKRERKTTGSYYTPDYIVKYIVENTVGPVLQNKFEALAPEFRKAQQAYREAVKRKDAFIAQKMKPTDPELITTREEFVKLVHDLFDIKVLDPAMGSGHFLVEAADFISDRLIDFLNGFPWNPVMKMLKDTRTTILTEMEKQGVNIDTQRLTDVNLIRRHVLKRAIYGVDLNPMAVELAKVSLWLNCFTLGAPLSFLDHHLKCGNSLVGVGVEEVQEKLHSGQMMLGGTEFTGLMLATDLMRHVGELSDVTADQVKESQREYSKASDALAPYKRILDVYTSRWFGNDVRTTGKGKKRREVDVTVEFLQSTESAQWLKNPYETKLTGEWKNVAEATILAVKKMRIFHWEFEFPEVFYEKGNLKEHRGFDVVIGNPPYVNVVELEDSLRNFVLERFSLAVGRIDIYIAFIEKALYLLGQLGRTAYITPNKWYVYGYGLKLRQLLYRQFRWVSSVDLSLAPSVFEDADTYSQISVVEKSDVSGEENIAVYRFVADRPELIADLNSAISINVVEFGGIAISKLMGLPDAVFAPRYIDKRVGIVDRVYSCGDLTKSQFGIEQLIRVGSEKKRAKLVIVPDEKSELPMDARKVIDADELTRWSIEWEGRYILYRPSELYNPKDPSIFEREKIFVKDTSTMLQVVQDLGEPRASANEKWFYALNTVYALVPIIPKEGLVSFVSACFNTKLLDFIYKTLFGALTIGGGFIRFREYIQFLPIRRIHFTTPKIERSELMEKGKKLYKKCLAEDDPLCVNEFVVHLLPKDEQGNFLAFKDGATGAEEKSDVVHDLLVYLAEEMIRLNKEKQLEMKKFFGLLEKKAKITGGIDSISGRNVLKNYLGDYQQNENEVSFEEILRVLQKNKSKLGISPSVPTLITELKREYEASLARLLPIKRSLSFTDKLIDQIVYKLYGLTEEEIKIVEGK